MDASWSGILAGSFARCSSAVRATSSYALEQSVLRCLQRQAELHAGFLIDIFYARIGKSRRQAVDDLFPMAGRKRSVRAQFKGIDKKAGCLARGVEEMDLRSLPNSWLGNLDSNQD